MGFEMCPNHTAEAGAHATFTGCNWVLVRDTAPALTWCFTLEVDVGFRWRSICNSWYRCTHWKRNTQKTSLFHLKTPAKKGGTASQDGAAPVISGISTTCTNPQCKQQQTQDFFSSGQTFKSKIVWWHEWRKFDLFAQEDSSFVLNGTVLTWWQKQIYKLLCCAVVLQHPFVPCKKKLRKTFGRISVCLDAWISCCNLDAVVIHVSPLKRKERFSFHVS